MQGLPQEERLKLIKKYSTPWNCKLIDPPKLNTKIHAAVHGSVLNRDNHILEKQIKLTTTGSPPNAKTIWDALKEPKENINIRMVKNWML